MTNYLRFPHALSEVMTEYESEALQQAMRRAGYNHDLKRRLAILQEIQLMDEEEACIKKQTTMQEYIVRHKSRRKSGKKLQRAQFRKEKRLKAVERDRKLRPPKM